MQICLGIYNFCPYSRATWPCCSTRQLLFTLVVNHGDIASVDLSSFMATIWRPWGMFTRGNADLLNKADHRYDEP